MPQKSASDLTVTLEEYRLKCLELLLGSRRDSWNLNTMAQDTINSLKTKFPSYRAFTDCAESLKRNHPGNIDDATWKTINDELEQHQRNIKIEMAAQQVTAESFCKRYDQFISLLSDEQKKSHFISAHNAHLRSSRVREIIQIIPKSEGRSAAKRRILYGFAHVPSSAKVFGPSGQPSLTDTKLDTLAYNLILAEMSQGFNAKADVKTAVKNYVKRNSANIRKIILDGYKLAKKTNHARATLATQTLNSQLKSYGWFSTLLKITDMTFEELPTKRTSSPTTTFGASQAPTQRDALPDLKVKSRLTIAKDDYEMYEVLTGPIAGGTRQVKSVTLPASLTTMGNNATESQKEFVKTYFASTKIDGVEMKGGEIVIPYSGKEPSGVFLEQMKAGLMDKNSVNTDLKQQLENYETQGIRVEIKLINKNPQQPAPPEEEKRTAESKDSGAAGQSRPVWSKEVKHGQGTQQNTGHPSEEARTASSTAPLGPGSSN